MVRKSTLASLIISISLSPAFGLALGRPLPPVPAEPWETLDQFVALEKGTAVPEPPKAALETPRIEEELARRLERGGERWGRVLGAFGGAAAGLAFGGPSLIGAVSAGLVLGFSAQELCGAAGEQMGSIIAEAFALMPRR